MLIPLTRGLYAIVDAEDADRVLIHNWRADRDGYAARNTIRDGRCVTIFLHQEILVPPAGMKTDHANRCRLDNRRANLRPATNSQNRINSTLSSANTSGFRGVSWHKKAQRWQAKLNIHGRSRWLGFFATAEDAARAYDRASLERDADFAVLNFPDGDS